MHYKEFIIGNRVIYLGIGLCNPIIIRKNDVFSKFFFHLKVPFKITYNIRLAKNKCNKWKKDSSFGFRFICMEFDLAYVIMKHWRIINNKRVYVGLNKGC